MTIQITIEYKEHYTQTKEKQIYNTNNIKHAIDYDEMQHSKVLEDYLNDDVNMGDE